MKTIKILALCAIACMLAVSCGKKKEVPVVEEAQPEVYQPRHEHIVVDLNNIQTYNYHNAPAAEAATSVAVNYDEKILYQPVKIKYGYANGDTYTYVISDQFGLWENEAGRLRVVSDNEGTVWLQGQTKAGKFCEFVFYGDPKYNGKKIKPNSYRNLPAGEIKYCK